MAVPTSITDLDPIIANNSPAGSDAIGTTLDDYLRSHAGIIRKLYDDLNSGALSVIPSGAMQMFFMNSAPTGWLEADGSAVSRTTYAALFAAIGTTHGSGNGTTTFNLPDMRGYFPRASGTNGDGTAAGTFGAKQADANKSHSHSGSSIASDGSHTHTVNDPGHTHTVLGGQPGLGGGTYVGDTMYGYYSTTSGATTGISINAGGAHTHGLTIAADGGTETRPKNMALLCCIKI